VLFQSVAAVMPIPAGSGFQHRCAGWHGLSSGSAGVGQNTPPGKNTPESACETKAGAHRSPAGCRFWILNKINASRAAPLDTARVFSAGATPAFEHRREDRLHGFKNPGEPDESKESTMTTRTYKVNSVGEAKVEESHDEAGALMEKLLDASLCANCRDQSDCVYFMKAGEPIIECEMYECGSSSKPWLSLVKGKLAAAVDALAEEDNPMGLCANCDNLKVCQMPKPQSGVWNCEEYA